MSNIIPNGKSDLFHSQLDRFKDQYVQRVMANAYDQIPEIEVEAKGSGCGGFPVKDKPPMNKEDLKITEGDEPETKDSKKKPCKSSNESKHVSLAVLTDEQKKKIKEYWNGILPDTNFGDALSKDY